MRLRSNILTATDVAQAFSDARKIDGADIHLEDLRSFTPRRHTYGVEFYAYSTNGRYVTGHRQIGSYPLDDVNRAASWDAYGWVIARLYLKDPQAQIGYYDNAEDFKRKVLQASYRKEPKDFLDLLEQREEAAR